MEENTNTIQKTAAQEISEAKSYKVLSLKDYLLLIGPALVISAVIIGPGSVTTLSSMGANYGYVCLWCVVGAALAAYIYQEPAIRLVSEQGKSVLEAVRENYSPLLAKVMFAMILFGALVFQAGNFIGAAMAMNYFIPQLSIIGWTLLMIILGLVMALKYETHFLEVFTEGLIAVMIVAFCLTAFKSSPSFGQMMSEGFSFEIPKGDFFLVLALLGTTMVPDIPVSLSALYKEKFVDKKKQSLSKKDIIKTSYIDLICGSVATGLISCAILICAAAVLHPQGIKVKSAIDMSMQLVPVLGNMAGILFALGLWAAAFSSGLFRLKLIPMLYNQAWGLPGDINNSRSRKWIFATAIIPFIIVCVFGSAPVSLIITAQAINGVLLPVTCGIVWKISSDKKLLNDRANSMIHNLIFLVVFVVTVFLSVKTFMGFLH